VFDNCVLYPLYPTAHSLNHEVLFGGVQRFVDRVTKKARQSLQPTETKNATVTVGSLYLTSYVLGGTSAKDHPSRVAVISAKNHKSQRRKRQSVAATREK